MQGAFFVFEAHYSCISQGPSRTCSESIEKKKQRLPPSVRRVDRETIHKLTCCVIGTNVSTFERGTLFFQKSVLGLQTSVTECII